MRRIVSKHPAFIEAQDIQQICKPLNQLGITYFGHVRIDKDNKFSALINNPNFLEHYLKHHYYNVDIHTASKYHFGQFVVWDSIERVGTSKKMHQEAAQFGVKHTFTIIEKNQTASNYYHFATDLSSRSINQVYLANLDLLKLFISKFNNQVSQSKNLAKAYDLKFTVDEHAEGYTLELPYHAMFKNIDRDNFIKIMNKHFSSSYPVAVNKNNYDFTPLAPQQMRCLQLLLLGNSAKQIASQLNLSPRTVEHYLERIRKMLGCKSNKEILIKYGINFL